MRAVIIAAAACVAPAAWAFAPAAPRSAAASRRSASTALQAVARKPLIAGNWKQYPCSLQEAQDLGAGVAEAAKQAGNVDVVIIPPYPFLVPVKRVAGKEDSEVMIGGQVSHNGSLNFCCAV